MGDIADRHVEMYESGRWGIPMPGWKDCPHCGRRNVMYNDPPADKDGTIHKCPEGTKDNAWDDRYKK